MSSARTVLIVDDEVGITIALRRALSRAGYTVVTCTRPAEALARLESGAFDVVISDQRMPGMEGTELMRLVHERRPETLRLILTGTPDISTAKEAIERGDVHRIVTKPWSNADLCATIERDLDARQGFKSRSSDRTA